MTKYYKLEGETVFPSSMLEWAKSMEAPRWNQRTSNEDSSVTISTTFLGLDHQFGDGPPLIFETLVFGGDYDGEMERYSTIAEAKEGHRAFEEKVLGIKASFPSDPVNR